MRNLSVLLAIAGTVWAGASFADDAGKQISGDAIVQALGGHKVDAVTLKGKTWSAEFKSDGTVAYGGGNSGTWRVDGDKFCDHPKNDDEYCGNILDMGGNKYQWVKPGATKGTVLTIAQ